MQNVVIWDIDNCLSNEKWRTKYIEWDNPVPNDRYNVYDSKLFEDAPANLEVWEVMRRLGTFPIFFTGRRTRWRRDTERWIKSQLNLNTLPIVLMREEDDNGKPVVVKERMLDIALNNGMFKLEDVIAAFDDVPSIVAMYRRRGIRAAELRIHDPALSYKQEDL